MDIETLIPRIKAAFKNVPRPVPVENDIDDYWKVIEEQYEDSPDTAEENFDTDIDTPLYELLMHDRLSVQWMLPRFMCGILRDGLINSREIIHFLNLEDNMLALPEEAWIATSRHHNEVLKDLDRSQLQVIIDWLEQIRDSLRHHNDYGDAELADMADRLIIYWRKRLNQSTKSDLH